jgi:pimeloyl-ACP methyl ester carboxylesterase
MLTHIAAALLAAADSGAAATAREREISIRSHGVELKGSLLLPEGRAPHPGIVLLPGSGPESRGWLRPFAERFARAGVAAVVFDKRGTGSSGGSWVEASLDDLADDARAAAAALRAQPEIDASRVGLWGISQSGWVIPRAVAKEPRAFAFAIVITGGGVRPSDVERYDYRAKLDALGVTAEERREGLAVVEAYFSYLDGKLALPELEARIAQSKDRRWFSAVDVSNVIPDEKSRAQWAWVPDYEPSADIRQMPLPTLVVLGSADRPELSLEMERLWRAGLSAAANQDAAIAVFLGAGHGVTRAGEHHMSQHFAPGYQELVEGWLDAHLRAALGH